MKCVMLMALILASVVLCLSESPSEIRARLQTVFKSIHDKCQSDPDTFVPESYSDEIDFEQIYRHFRCMSTLIGWQNEDGTANTEEVKKFLSKGITNETMLDEVTQKCTEPQETPNIVATHLWFCIGSHIPGFLNH